MYQVWLKYLDIYSSYRPENENMGVYRADNSIKLWRKLPISNPKPDLHNSNAHTKFSENPLMFTQVIIRIRKYGRVSGRKLKLPKTLTKFAD